MVPKDEPDLLDFELPPEPTLSTLVEENVASSSGSNIRSSLIGMGFSPSLVDKVIEEKGDGNLDLLLESLFAYSDLQKKNSESSDSMDSLFDDYEASSLPEVSTVQLKEEPDIRVNDEKRTSLLRMNFSIKEVEFALAKLDEDAPIHEIVDFILAAQIAERDMDTSPDGENKTREVNTEILYGTMEKTLRLLEMGFTENEISLVIERFGSEVPVSELADSIFAAQNAIGCVKKEKDPSTSFGLGMEEEHRSSSYDISAVKTEDFGSDIPQFGDFPIEETYSGKRPKEEYLDDWLFSDSQPQQSNFEEMHRGKKAKEEWNDDSRSFFGSTRNSRTFNFGGSKPFELNPRPSKSLDQKVAKPPYFFYGNVVNVSPDSWVKISQFLYGVEPEFVNTQFFSALSRKEGYIHNLPSENRHHIFPKPPMKIEDAIPHTKKWWPSWDTRKQLSCISSETSGMPQIYERLGRILISSQGILLPEQQRDILHQCRTHNLVWIGQYKLGPIEPEQLERILGYPSNHTQASEWTSTERVEALKHCFQTDTLGYHISALKSLYPRGLTMVSIFTGVGGAEVALHRLGIKFKAIVSVETSETKRKILKRWWSCSGQTGELVQLEDIKKLTSHKLETLSQRFGGLDFVICQSPCTYTSKSKTASGSDNVSGLDYPQFYEFTRVLKRVKDKIERKR